MSRGTTGEPAGGAGRLEGASGLRLRSAFRYVNRFMVALWRLGLGRWLNVCPRGSGRIMVLGHIGRRTGLRRWTPLNYAQLDDTIFVIAGFGPGSDWYRNVIAAPRVEAWLPGRRWAADVEEISDHPQRVRLIREVLLASGFAATAAGIDPRRMDDATLTAATSTYRLLRLRPAAGSEMPDHPRPADLAWVWLLLGAVIAVLAAMLRPRPDPVICRARQGRRRRQPAGRRRRCPR